MSAEEQLSVGTIVGLKLGSILLQYQREEVLKTLLKDYSKEVSEQLELHNRNLKNVLYQLNFEFTGIIISLNMPKKLQIDIKEELDFLEKSLTRTNKFIETRQDKSLTIY